MNGYIEITVQRTGETYRPMCNCTWVGLTVPDPKDAANHYLQHWDQAHADKCNQCSHLQNMHAEYGCEWGDGYRHCECEVTEWHLSSRPLKSP